MRPLFLARLFRVSHALQAVSFTLGMTLACGCSNRSSFETESKRGEISLVARLDTTRVAIAEPMQFSIEVTSPEGVSVAFPSERDWLGEFRVLESTRLMDVPLEQHRMSRWQMTLESYTSGSVLLPAVAIAVTDGRGPLPVQEVIRTPTVEVTVKGVASSLLGRPEFQEIEGPLPPPVSWSFWIALISAILVLALVLKAGQLILTVRRRHTAARRKALMQLTTLHDFLRDQPEQVDVALAKLTSILRTYYARTFQTRPQATSEELLADLEQGTQIGGLELRELRTVLECADRLSYGNKAAYLGETRELIRRSQQLVDSQLGQSTHRSSADKNPDPGLTETMFEGSS